MDQQYNLEVGNYNVDYYMEQLGEAVVVFFTKDLVQEYEVVEGELVETIVVGSSGNVATTAEASTKRYCIC